MKSLSTRKIRFDTERNRTRLFEALVDLQPATLAALADATSMHPVSVKRHLRALIAAREVYCIKAPDPRRPDHFRVEMTDAARRAAAAQARMLRTQSGGAAA